MTTTVEECIKGKDIIHTIANTAITSSHLSVLMVEYLVITRAITASTVAMINIQVTTLMTEPWCAGEFHKGASAAVKLVDVITSLILSTFLIVSRCDLGR